MSTNYLALLPYAGSNPQWPILRGQSLGANITVTDSALALPEAGMRSSGILAGILRREEGLIRHFLLEFPTMWFRGS